ncbi:F-box/LRR-repeat protein 4 [Eucalyptus grandis]|uniref:F-box/LRR-repeat protein 4 n=1 Tax=Eucalyptus grandis TaxID=71139 RepID=UPI00192E8941|nr:F-box/LRR-repeat protein 4 [Eucalyptus grandis]
MSVLGFDELSLILQRVASPDRKSFSEVCRQWLRVEGLSREGIRVLEPDLLRCFLPRFPNLAKFECSKVLTDAEADFVARTCLKIESLNLSRKQPRDASWDSGERSDADDLGSDGLCALAGGCPRLSEVLLRRRKNVEDVGVVSLVERAKNLRTLDLGWCSLITDQSLEAIGRANCVRTLNLEGCSKISDAGLAYLASGSLARTLKKLVLAEYCGPRVTDNGGIAIAAIKSLRKLNLAWLINLSDTTLFAVAEKCENLASIDLTGCELISGAGIRAFENHSCLDTLVLANCYSVNVHDLEQMVLGCQSLQNMVLPKGLIMWMPEAMRENICRLCSVDWK